MNLLWDYVSSAVWVVGALSAIAGTVQALRYGLGRGSRARSEAVLAAPDTKSALPPSVLRNLPRVKPRTHFGLRGLRD